MNVGARLIASFCFSFVEFGVVDVGCGGGSDVETGGLVEKYDVPGYGFGGEVGV